jgi:intein/homing endonuclease
MFFGPSFESDPFWLFATAEDERVCEICGPLDGMVFSKIDEAGRHFLPGLHFNCVPAETRVEGLFRTGFRSLYSGEMVEIESEGGARLTVTGDHPVFTETGLIPGRDLGEGARVFRYRVGDHTSARINDENVPSRAAEVFGALEKAGARCENPGRRVDLYGNAGRDERYIDVVTVDRKLADGPADHPGDSALMTSFASNSAHHADSRAPHFIVGTHSPARGLPRASTLTHDSGPVSARPFEGLRFGSTALLDAALVQHSNDDAARHSALVGESVHGDSGMVALEKIVKVRKVEAVMWPTFDFEAAHGVIVADGIAIGNCRCTAIEMSADDVRAGGYKVTPGHSITSPRPAEGFDIDGLDLVPEELRRAA